MLRSDDYLIWELIFVRAIGLGPLPGIMAIAIVDTGILIVLYSDALENIDRKQIDEMSPAKTSMMPAGLFNTLEKEEILDLMAFLLSRGDRNHKMFK